MLLLLFFNHKSQGWNLHEVMAIWHYTNLIIITIIIKNQLVCITIMVTSR